MWLKIFSLLGIVLQVVLQLVQAMSQSKLRQEGKKELEEANEEIIKNLVNEAEHLRADASLLNDNLLLEPAQRNTGGVPGVSADLLRFAGGGADAGKNANSEKNQGSQFHMGEELSPFAFAIPKRKIVKVFIHCSASDRDEDDNVKTIDEWHRARGWSGIGYNYYLDKKGRAWAGRDIQKIPAAQQGFNTGSIAICCGGKNSFTAAQFLSLKNVCKTIAREYLNKGVKITFHGHCEVSSKTCPNFDYRNILGLDKNGQIKL